MGTIPCALNAQNPSFYIFTYWYFPLLFGENTKFSVLTRILPWGVPGPPLLRNRGPVRTLGGQSYKKHAARYKEPEPALQIVCYMKYLPDPIWRKRCLPFGGGVYDVVGRAWDQ